MKTVTQCALMTLTVLCSTASLAGGADHMAPAKTQAPSHIASMPVSPAAQENHFYLALDGGYTLPRGSFKVHTQATPLHNEFNNGYNIGGGIGYQLANPQLPLRFELSGRYTHLNKSAHGHYQSDGRLLSLMANTYFDFHTGAFSPYVGIGLGVANLTMKQAHTSYSSAGLGYQGTLGITYQFNAHVHFNASYRLLATTAKVTVNKTSFDYSAALLHSFDVGMTYRFI